ncbi:MAG: metal ABC transporter ATP-binding protein [Infirmifilum sp.]
MHENITLEGINLSFAYNSDVILRDENFTLEGYGLYTILGPNGSGKTTFFKVLLGLLKPLKGKVLVNGVDVTGNPLDAGKYMSYVPQLSNMDYNYPVTGRELIESSLKFGRRIRDNNVSRRVDYYLSLVKAKDFADKKVSSLSGGQLQRILIARALARETPILLLDEPFSGIDPRGRDEIVNIVNELSSKKMLLITTHDPVLTVKISRKVLVFNRGIKAIGSPSDVFRLELLRKAYGENILLIEKCLHVIA